MRGKLYNMVFIKPNTYKYLTYNMYTLSKIIITCVTDGETERRLAKEKLASILEADLLFEYAGKSF